MGEGNEQHPQTSERALSFCYPSSVTVCERVGETEREWKILLTTFRGTKYPQKSIKETLKAVVATFYSYALHASRT